MSPRNVAAGKRGKSTAMVAILFAGILLLITVPRLPHLKWYFGEGRAGSRGTKSIPVVVWTVDDEPNSLDSPEGMRKIEIDALEFLVPTTFLQDFAAELSDEWLAFACDKLSLRIRKPVPNDVARDALLANSPQFKRETEHAYVATWADLYAVSPDDFRWSMSADEFVYFRWLLANCEKHRTWQTKQVAVFYGKNVDGFAHISEKSIILELYPCNGRFFVSILVDGEKCGAMTKEDVAAMIVQSISWGRGC
jgi:hypothetical protein